MSIKSQNISFVNVVSKLINDKGLEVIQKPSLLEAYLNDLIPNNSSEIFLINVSLKEDIASIIFNDKIDFETKNLQLAKKLHTLTNEYYLSCDGATKVIELWKSIYKETNCTKNSIEHRNNADEAIYQSKQNIKLSLNEDFDKCLKPLKEIVKNITLPLSSTHVQNTNFCGPSAKIHLDQRRNHANNTNKEQIKFNWLDYFFFVIGAILLYYIFIQIP
jgi:hypothetical protein